MKLYFRLQRAVVVNYKKNFPFIHKNCFYNYPGEPSHFSFKDTFKSATASLIQTVRRNKCSKKAISFHQSCNAIIKKPIITWLGHATFLIQLPGITLITDPVLASPSPILQRLISAYDISTLPKIDVVIISHNHRDHMDIQTLKALHKFNPELDILLPHGNRHYVRNIGISHEHMWWDQWQKKQLSCTFLPARHWSQRGLFDRNTSLWGSWMVQDEHNTIYFGGDSAYGDHYATIAHNFNTIDYALLPIGPCDESLRDVHMNAEEAGKAFLDLQAHACIPMHFGTFLLGDADIDLPLKRFIAWWESQTLTATKQLLLPQQQGLRP
ncbi:MAG: hypothetical protein UU47_C0001G0043 [candidate division TM6 bacterium GW2011_GWE2_41_16]|nr:MAG: hypothetical protein UU47_C0001G0043 [candidate division TM6 bacterium GW2011_GWE2_41_16]